MLGKGQSSVRNGAPVDDLGDVGVDVLEGLPDDALRNAADARDADGDVPLQRLAAHGRRHLLDRQHALDGRLHVIRLWIML